MEFQFKESTKDHMTCPLGAVCADCALFVTLYQEAPTGGTVKLAEQKICAWVAGVLMADRTAGRVDGLHAAFNSFRNEMVRGQEAFDRLLRLSAQQRRSNSGIFQGKESNQLR